MNSSSGGMGIVGRLADAISRKDIDEFASLYCDDAIVYEPLLPEPARGRREIVEGEAALFRAFSDVSVEIRNVFESGGVKAAEVVLTAVNDGPLDLGGGEIPPTGRRIEVPMMWVFELDENGLVVEERDYFDTARIMQQLGLNDAT